MAVGVAAGFSGGAAADVPPSLAEAASPNAAGEPSGQLRFGYYILPTSFDPHLSTNPYDQIGLALTYDRLVHLTPDGEAVAGLAERWVFSEDGLTLDLTIRDGVEFHDGEQLTPEAVVASLDRAKNLEGSTSAGSLEAVEAIDVVDGVVRLSLSTPAAQLPLVLAERAGMIISPAALEADLATEPVGAGMYRLTDLRIGDVATFEAFDGYWDPDAIGVESVVYRQVTDVTTALNAARAGELDIVPLDANSVSPAEDSGLTIVRGPTVTTQTIQFNRAVAPFDDVRVRQAVNHAIDRDALVEGIFLGFARPAGQLFSSNSPAFDEATGADPYPYDLERARELLTEAGFPDGMDMELIASTIPAHQLMATGVQAQLGNAGIDVTIRTLPPEQITEVAYVNQDLQAQLAFGGSLDPVIVMTNYFGVDSFSNPGRHTTPEMTEALEAANLPGDGRNAALQHASAVVSEQALTAPLVFADGIFAAAPGVEGFVHWVSARPEFRGVHAEEG
ncbi:MAG: ABC transporter substrate-binding protein [Desertimonas sp.]